MAPRCRPSWPVTIALVFLWLSALGELFHPWRWLP